MAEKGLISNPILRGFNPDPSIIRVGDSYYIATSTFEWFPGVQIHHSTDLINWQLINRPLDRSSQLNLLGIPDSCGVWAPCLSFQDGTFYLVYSIVRSFSGVAKDLSNFVVTATNINGPWSEPVYLNNSGFDPSLFHDDNGCSYLINMLMDPRENRLFGGIILQEFDRETSTLSGKVHYLFDGTHHGCTEGPHLYKRGNYYYLILAEGGTGYDHCVTLLRSKSVTGPYELHPENPILTAQDGPQNELQKAGHADLVETQEGDWYAVFLTGRPITERGACTLGRETAIARVIWNEDDWLYLDSDNKHPHSSVTAPEFAHDVIAQTNNSKHIVFSEDKPLDIHFQSLRVPITPDWASLTARPGFLRLIGRDSLSSTFKQSLLGHRVQSHHARASTLLEFDPDSHQQTAGLVCYYNTGHYHYLHVIGTDLKSTDKRQYLTIASCDDFRTTELIGCGIDISGIKRIWLKADFNQSQIQFYYAYEEDNWIAIGPLLDGSILSDDYVAHEERAFQPCFTGAFFAICCQDLSGSDKSADFAFFDYEEVI